MSHNTPPPPPPHQQQQGYYENWSPPADARGGGGSRPSSRLRLSNHQTPEATALPLKQNGVRNMAAALTNATGDGSGGGPGFHDDRPLFFCDQCACQRNTQYQMNYSQSAYFTDPHSDHALTQRSPAVMTSYPTNLPNCLPPLGSNAMPPPQYYDDVIASSTNHIGFVSSPPAQTEIYLTDTESTTHALATDYISAPPSADASISHIDFWPSVKKNKKSSNSGDGIERACEAEYEDFDALVDRANRWMEQFVSSYEMINCETVDKKVMNVRDIYSASMYFAEEPDALATHIKGLRLWYRQRSSNQYTGYQISYYDFTPRYMNPEAKHPEFETLTQTIERVNHYVRENPIEGKLLNIETVPIKIATNELSCHIPSRQCKWYDDYNTHQWSFIRLFYIFGPPEYEIIGLKDFTPDVVAQGGIFSRKEYSPFTTLVEKARDWISQCSGVRITNIQTLDVKHRKRSEVRGNQLNPNRMFEYHIEERFRCFILRVGYVKPMDHSIPIEVATPVLSCKTFIPQRRRGDYENITEVVAKAQEHIERSKATVYFIETIAIPEWMTMAEFMECGDRTFYDGEWYFESDKYGNERGPYRHSYLYAIRFYYDGDVPDSDLALVKLKGNKACCQVM